MSDNQSLKDEHQSLHDTNIRGEGSVADKCDSSSRVLEGGEPIVEATQETQLFENLEISSRHTNESLNEKAASQNETQREESHVVQEPQNKDSDSSQEVRSVISDSPSEGSKAQHKEADAPIAVVSPNGNDKMENDDPIDDPNCDRRNNISRKEADCGGDANMSVQMYRYLHHNYLKRQIEDIAKRENTFVSKHCWDEALRLREMRNELILLKNKNLYDNHDLQIDDETRQSGLNIIEAREAMRKKRIRICDSMLYSDEAKDMWVQWSREDEAIAQTETNAMRDFLLKELENEWKTLSLPDKKRILQLKDRIMVKSGLQDEHKLAAEIQAANDSQKQYMNYLTT